MKTTRIGVWLAVAGLAAAGAGAQDNRDDQRPQRRRPAASPGLFFTDEIIDLAIDRMTDQMANEYAFDEDQLWNTRALIKERFPPWLREHRDEIIQLVNEYAMAMLSGDPPTPEYVADWASRAMPLFQEAFGMIDETTQEMRSYMTDEQQIHLDGQVAAFQVGRNYLLNRIQVWSDGGYDWESEWPRSEKFRQRERERREQVEREAERERLLAMGVNPETAGGAGPGAPPAGEKPAAQTRPVGPKDEWTTYVENFIKRYQLDEAQQNTARKILRSLQEERDHYLSRKGDDIQVAEKKLKAAQTDDQRASARTELDRLNQPLERYFDQLKDRLNRIPSRKQRAAAAQADMAARAKAESTSRPGKAGETGQSEKADHRDNAAGPRP
jgi:hypothetical protein